MSPHSSDRPLIHFTPEHGWINDPHGLTWHQGKYHLFFQYLPDRSDWAPDCRWGHATSVDLMAWVEEPVALSPGDGDVGVWTGSLVDDGRGRWLAFYTAVDEPDLGLGRIRVAVPDTPDWISWTKGRIVVDPPQGGSIVGFRDPFVFRDSDGWRMLVGAGTDERAGAVLSYHSPDLAEWDYDGVLSGSHDVTGSLWTGTLWECPQLFDIDGSHVLVISVWADHVLHYVAYGVGAYADGHFTARSWNRLTFGPSHYAASFFRDASGRPGLLCWLRGISDETSHAWVGAHSIPYQLRLERDVLIATQHPSVVDAFPPIVVSGREGVCLSASPTPANFMWLAREGAELRLHGSGGVVGRLHHRDARVVAALDNATDVHAIPLNEPVVRVLIDGPILEISTDRGLFACQVPHVAGISVTQS